MMRETTPRLQRIYLRFEDAGHGAMRLSASLVPPAYNEPMMVLLSRGVLPSGQPMSLLLVSDPSQDETLRGTPGASAYQLAQQQGYAGSLADWLTSLVGAGGLSAYQLARQQGYGGTLTAWLASLVGASGASAYDLARTAGFGGTQTQWLASLKGTPAGAMLGTVAVSQTATAAIVAGVRRLTVTIPVTLGVATGDPLILCPTQALAGYAIHDVVAVSPTSLSIGLTSPALAIGASFSISCKLFRLNT